MIYTTPGQVEPAIDCQHSKLPDRVSGCTSQAYIGQNSGEEASISILSVEFKGWDLLQGKFDGPNKSRVYKRLPPQVSLLKKGPISGLNMILSRELRATCGSVLVNGHCIFNGHRSCGVQPV